MTFNFDNFFDYRNKNKKMGHFQDLEHIDGLSISTTSANLYNRKRDDLVMFYFRDGANYASVYTQSKIVSENIKELEIILCDNSTSLTSNLLLDKPVDNSIITFNNTIGNSSYNTFVQNSTLRVNNILENSFTVSNLHLSQLI